MEKRFKVILEWNDDESGYTVTVPALPGCVSEGDTLQEALDNVREAITGFIEAVHKPASAEVRALIADVNNKRRTQFNRTAQKTGTSVAQVSRRFYELAVQKTASGHFYQDSERRWKKK